MFTNALAALWSAIIPQNASIAPSASTHPIAGTPSVGTADAKTGAVSGSLNFTNPAHGTLTYTVTTQPTSGTVSVNSQGTYTYKPTQLARDVAAISAGSTAATFQITANNGQSSATETVTIPIAPTVISGGDSTAVLQDVFNNSAVGSTITLAQQTFYTSNVITIGVQGLTINGNGATIQATNDALSSVQVVADHVTVSNLILGANLTGPRYYAPDQHKLVIYGDYATINSVTINGSAGAGVFVYGAGWFTLNNVTVNNSRADGIHMTDGAHDGVLNNPVTNNTGDDGIAVVSYVDDGKISHNITINSPVVNGTTWGRGLAVVGGQNITFNNITVSNTNAAGVYVASESSYNTFGVSGVTINGGSITGANNNAAVVHGALMVYAGNAGKTVTNVTFENLTISGTPASAQRVIGIVQEPNAGLSGIVFKNLSIDKTTLPILSTNAAPGSYTTSRITVGGIAKAIT